MIKKILVCSAVAIVCHVENATASVLSGEFSGTAINSYFVPYIPPGENIDGASITGSFDIEPTSFLETSIYAGVTYTILTGTGQIQTSIPAIGQFDAINLLDYIAESESMGVQTLDIEFGDYFSYQYDTDKLTLTGTGLFDPANPLMLSPGMIDIALSGGSEYAHFYFGTGIKLNSVTFDTPVAVREPSTISLLALWSGGFMLLRSLPRAFCTIRARMTAARRWLQLQRQSRQLAA